MERRSFLKSVGGAVGTGAIGLGVAIDYVDRLGWDFIQRQEALLLEAALEKLAAIPGLRFVGSAIARASVVSFVIEGEVAAVRSAIEAARTSASAIGEVISEIVIPRPVDELHTTFKE